MITGCGARRSLGERSAPQPVITELVLGVGMRPGAPEQAVRALLGRIVARHRPDLDDLDVAAAEVVTLDRRAGEPGLLAAVAPRVPRGFATADLAAVAVPAPSDRVARATGTPSVAEAAALLAAGPGATLLVPRTVGDGVTAALARRATGTPGAPR